MRPDDGRDCPCVPDTRADTGTANRSNQTQDSRRPHTLRGPVACGITDAARRGTSCHLSRLQRGLRGFVGRHRHAPRPLSRSDPARTGARRSTAGAGSGGPAGADAAPGLTPRRAHVARGRSDSARGSGSIALESASSGPSVPAGQDRIPFRRRSRRCTPALPTRRQPIGPRSSVSTTSSGAWTDRP